MTQQDIAVLGKALFGCEARAMLFDLIVRYEGTKSVAELEERLEEAGHELSQPTVSHHLRILRKAGLVDFHQRGLYEHYYFARQAPLARLREALDCYVDMAEVADCEVLV